MERKGLKEGIRALAIIAATVLTGCAATGGGAASASLDGLPSAGPLPQGISPTTPFSAYLAAEFALSQRDPQTALALFEEALQQDPTNFGLANRVFIAALSQGRFDIAAPVAARLLKDNPGDPLANLTQCVTELAAGHAEQAYLSAKVLPDTTIFRFFAGFARAWTSFAQNHDAKQAIAELSVVGDSKTLGPLVPLHTALIEDLAGDSAAADASYQSVLASGHMSLRLAQLIGNYLERSRRPDEAAKLYAALGAKNILDVAATAPDKAPLAVPAPIIRNASDGLAEALFDMASIFSSESSPEAAEIGVRLTLELRPDFPLADLLLGEILENEKRDQAALTAYRSIKSESPVKWAARLREAALLERMGDHDAADRSLREMAGERPNTPEPVVELADALRERDRFQDAVPLYSEALERAGSVGAGQSWPLYFSRGIAYERSGQWPLAEADLRHALSLAPDQPDVLNYLGFALVDRHQRLPEAMDLIKRAVGLRPNDGFIVDSLGWAYYREGDVTHAETTLEQAVELRPGDAEINDHLGDAYWDGGREDEARLQWRRALSLNPEPDLAKAIEAKLERPPAAKHAGSVHGGS
jgi:tetratricopeptide (TPR) repeat protein